MNDGNQINMNIAKETRVLLNLRELLTSHLTITKSEVISSKKKIPQFGLVLHMMDDS